MTNAIEQEDQIKQLIAQRPELAFAGILKMRNGLIIVVPMHKTVKIFQKIESVFICIQELDIKGCQFFSLLDLGSEDALIISDGYSVKRIPYYESNNRYNVRFVEILYKSRFVVTELIELKDGSVIASFGNREQGESHFMEVIYGPQKTEEPNRSL